MSDSHNSNKPDATARGMVILAWISALVFLTWLAQGFLDKQYNPNQQLEQIVRGDGVREVVLQRGRDGHYVANGKINGESVTFLIDTGATDVAIPEALAVRLGLPHLGTVYGQTANGRVQGWRTRLESVRLGAVRLHDVRASVLPSIQAHEPILLGMSFLRQLEMVQRDGSLTLRQGAVSG